MCNVWHTFPGGCLSYDAPGWSLYKLLCWVGTIGVVFCCTAESLVRYVEWPACCLHSSQSFFRISHYTIPWITSIPALLALGLEINTRKLAFCKWVWTKQRVLNYTTHTFFCDKSFSFRKVLIHILKSSDFILAKCCKWVKKFMSSPLAALLWRVYISTALKLAGADERSNLEDDDMLKHILTNTYLA